jgi:hypothetical protein
VLLLLPLLVPLLLLPRRKRSQRKRKLMPWTVVWICSVVEEEEEDTKRLESKYSFYKHSLLGQDRFLSTVTSSTVDHCARIVSKVST